MNSAFFGLSHRVTDARHAVSYLGLATVRNLLTAVELVRAFIPPSAELVRAVEEIHAHSLGVAELARTLMVHRHQVHDTFTAGMMHDVGLLAIIAYLPDRYTAIREEVERSGRSLEEVELEIIGTSHAHLGAYLLSMWGLPYSLIEAVARSHDAESLPDRTMNPAHAVYIAEQVMNMMGTNGFSWESGKLPSEEYMQNLGVMETVAQLVGWANA